MLAATEDSSGAAGDGGGVHMYRRRTFQGPPARGSVLIEVLISTAVLSVGIAAITPIFSYGVERSAEARKLGGAQFLGNEVLERLRLEHRFDPCVAPGGGPAPCSAGSGIPAAGDGFEAWSASVLPFDPAVPVAGDGGGPGSCQPAPRVTDGVTYPAGPLRFGTLGGDYWVCWALDPAPAGNPPRARQVTVKVLWRTSSGWSARWLTGLALAAR